MIKNSKKNTDNSDSLKEKKHEVIKNLNKILKLGKEGARRHPKEKQEMIDRRWLEKL